MSDKSRELEERLTRIEDILAIQEVQYKYQHWLALTDSGGQRYKDKILELFTNTRDPSCEIVPYGVAVGHENVSLFFDDEASLSGYRGYYQEHYALHPFIEIAKDGKTAKASYMSPGWVLNPEKNMQFWLWGQYYMDYVKEDGEWKIWHLKWYEFFASDWQKGPLYEQLATHKMLGIDNTDELEKESQWADRPSTENKWFRLDGPNVLLAEPPEPYDTM